MEDLEFKWRLDEPLENVHGINPVTFPYALIERLDFICEKLVAIERKLNGEK